MNKKPLFTASVVAVYIQFIAHAPDCLDELPLFTHLAPKLFHMCVDRTGISKIIVVPDIIENLLPAFSIK